MDKHILEEAKYCLQCTNKPCVESCPVKTDIPKFINFIKEENMIEAYKVLSNNNIFSSVCSLVCPDELQCISKCTRGIKGLPVKIKELENAVNKWAKENNINGEAKISPSNGKKIAVIGSGPTSLAASYELLKMGCHVDIYEREDSIGGVLYYGIPDFRISKCEIDDVIKRFNGLDIKYFFNMELGKNIFIEDILKKYDAIFLGIGAGKSIKDNAIIEYNRLFTADAFLKEYNLKKSDEELGKVVVVGGGNVAVDCARLAVRSGAESVTIMYRNMISKLSATKREIEDAKKDNVKFVCSTKVINANSENKSIECVKTYIDDAGNLRDEVNTYWEQVDTLIYAIGQKADGELLKKCGIECNFKGYISVDENYKTNLEKVFAAGDVIMPKGTICKAVGTGKEAARAINKYIKRGE